MLVTIDGSAGSGKTTLAENMREQLGFIPVFSGSYYRILTFLFLQDKIPCQEAEVLTFLKNAPYFALCVEQNNFVIGQSTKPLELLYQKDIAQNISFYASLASVRNFVNAYIKNMLDYSKDFALEGRDMGIVFKEAEYKFFLEASSNQRALRISKQREKSQNEAEKEILNRDYLDENRKLSPLKKRDDQYVIDTTYLDRKKVLDIVASTINRSYTWKKRTTTTMN